STGNSKQSLDDASAVVPNINNPQVTEPGLVSRRRTTPQAVAIKGVAVTAMSSDDIEQMVIGFAGAGTVAAGISAGTMVVNNTTHAYIDRGAAVNTTPGAGAAQSVMVAAGSDLYHLGVAGAAGIWGEGAGGAGPA